jgi:GNAT superfamily N-acetyltransferase
MPGDEPLRPLTLPPWRVVEIPYTRAGTRLRAEFDRLQRRANGEPALPAGAPLEPLHDQALGARCFYVRAAGRLASYAAVVRTTARIDGDAWAVAGLSCVATDPEWRRRGLGTTTVAAATRAIERSGADLGVFTCDPELAGFYARAGGWPTAPAATLLGSREPGALSSAALGKVVLMRLLSERARQQPARLERAAIDLGLPVGQFL